MLAGAANPNTAPSATYTGKYPVATAHASPSLCAAVRSSGALPKNPTLSTPLSCIERARTSPRARIITITPRASPLRALARVPHPPRVVHASTSRAPRVLVILGTAHSSSRARRRVVTGTARAAIARVIITTIPRALSRGETRETSSSGAAIIEPTSARRASR